MLGVGSWQNSLLVEALGLTTGVRAEWDAVDFILPSGVAIEVKSSAYVQTWAQRKESSICFSIRPTRRWSADTNVMANESERRRQADIYVFALLHHRVRDSFDPLDLAQWRFYVLPTERLNAHHEKQKMLSLASLLKLAPVVVEFEGLKHAIENVDLHAPSAALHAVSFPPENVGLTDANGPRVFDGSTNPAASDEFIEWRAQHRSDGFYLNRSPKNGWMLHCANCWHVEGSDLARSIKVCSTEIALLGAWLKERGDGEARRCQTCRPPELPAIPD